MAVSKEQKKQNAEAFASMFDFVHSQGAPVALLDDDYTLDCGKPADGKHYWVRDCPNCGDDAPFFEDRTAGKITNPLSGLHRLHTECVHCGSKVSAYPNEIRSILWNDHPQPQTAPV